MSYQGPHVPFLDVMEDYDIVYDYLMKAAYPSGCSKNQRRVMRRRCIDHFKVSGGILYYSKTTSGTDKRDWRIVVKTVADKKRILEACHSNHQGKTLWNMQITDQVATNMTFAVLAQVEFCLILLLGNLYFC